MKSAIPRWVAAGLLAALALTTAILLFRRLEMDKGGPYRLKEPMLVATNKDVPYYMIPANTVLYRQRGVAISSSCSP